MSPSHRDMAKNSAASSQGVGNLKVDKNMRIVDCMREPMVEVLLRVLGEGKNQETVQKLSEHRDKQTLGKWISFSRYTGKIKIMYRG